MENLKRKIEKLMGEYKEVAEIPENKLSMYHHGQADAMQTIVWELEKMIAEEEIGQEDIMGEGMPY